MCVYIKASILGGCVHAPERAFMRVLAIYKRQCPLRVHLIWSHTHTQK